MVTFKMDTPETDSGQAFFNHLSSGVTTTFNSR